MPDLQTENHLKETYIKIPAVYRKLKIAEEEDRTLYISGVGGVGKTAAVRYFYRKKNVLWLNCECGILSQMLLPDSIRQRTVVIDDLSSLSDEIGREYVRHITESRNLHCILIGRSGVPDWLKVQSLRQTFLLADVCDMLWGTKEIRKLFTERSIQADDNEIEKIYSDTTGYTLDILNIARYLESGRPYNPQVLELAMKDTYDYFNHHIYALWDNDMKDLILCMSQYDRFDIQMAQIMTGNQDAGNLIEKIINSSDTLLTNGDGTWSERPKLRKYMQIKWDSEFPYVKKAYLYNQAGIYYELKKDVPNALKLFSLAGNDDKVRQILVKNAQMQPGAARLFELRQYYLNIPEKVLLNEPVLMAELSMLYSVMLQPEKSEEWYVKLQEFEKNSPRGTSVEQEAKSRLIFLDISLPHRGTDNLLQLVKNASAMMNIRRLNIPEMSVTSNAPSLMHGGKDFCEWSRHDAALAKTMGKIVETLLKNYGVGLVNIALAESGIEKGSIDSYEAVTLLNRGYTMAETGGKIEICFAAVGLMALVHVENGKLSMARAMIMDFRQKVLHEEASQLLANVDALLFWFDLLIGRQDRVKTWMSAAPNENLEFQTMERYRYLMKVRGYIADGQLDSALNLTERLVWYFESYKRTYDLIQANILRAIILFRMKNEIWKESLISALTTAQNYHFIPVIAREGQAVYPLLQAFVEFESSEKFSHPMLKSAWFRQMMHSVKSAALKYPDYLEPFHNMENELTESERTVMTLLCRGVSSEEICAKCGISYSTLKFHKHNLYIKLNVKSQSEAIEKACKLGF